MPALPVLLFSLLATLLVFGLLSWYARHREVIFRQNALRMVERLELILSFQASEKDWDLFLALPIRNNPELEEIRQICREIGETEYVGNPFNKPGRPLFTEWGLMLLERQLNQARRLLQQEVD
jgi:hypothetical protein